MTHASNPFIVDETLVAERLIEAFDNQDPRFSDYFAAADRVTLGALVAYASLAMRTLAERDGVPLPDIRRAVRAQVASAAAATQKNGEAA
jgi:hypothetical protein